MTWEDGSEAIGYMTLPGHSVHPVTQFLLLVSTALGFYNLPKLQPPLEPKHSDTQEGIRSVISSGRGHFDLKNNSSKEDRLSNSVVT